MVGFFIQKTRGPSFCPREIRNKLLTSASCVNRSVKERKYGFFPFFFFPPKRKGSHKLFGMSRELGLICLPVHACISCLDGRIHELLIERGMNNIYIYTHTHTFALYIYMCVCMSLFSQFIRVYMFWHLVIWKFK